MALGVAAAVALVLLLGKGAPDPALAQAGRTLVAVRAEAASRALEQLDGELGPALSAARKGAAAVVAGERRPSEDLAEAAEALSRAAPAARTADAAMAALRGARLAMNPAAAPLAFDVAPGEVESIAAQLEGTSAAADDFVAMRLRAEGLAGLLDEAIVALEADDLGAAEDRLRAARRDLDAIEAWDVDFVTLPVWITTTGATVGALERIVTSTRAGDRAGAARAAEDFAARRDEAAPADRALRIAIGEGGSAVTAAPLGRLAELLRAVDSAREQVASIVQTVGR